MGSLRQWRRPAGRELVAGLLTWVALLGFVVLTYLIVVLGGAGLLGVKASPLALSVLATAVVALLFDRVQAHAEATVARAVRRGRPMPYEVLRSLSGTLGGSHAVEELPARIAKVLVEGTGATWCQVWVVVDGDPRAGRDLAPSNGHQGQHGHHRRARPGTPIPARPSGRRAARHHRGPGAG